MKYKKIFNGHNHYNNEILFNIEHNTVKFKPVKKHNLLYYWLMFYQVLVIIPLYFFLYSMVFLIMVNTIILKNNEVTKMTFLFNMFTYTTFMVIVLALPLWISMIFFYPKFRNSIYPKVFYTLRLIAGYIVQFKDIRKKRIIEAKGLTVINGQYFYVFSFDNIMLTYLFEGDFSRQVQRINIMHKGLNLNDFICYITFKKKPKNGKMYLSYI